MFNFFKKNSNNCQTKTFDITGLHCSSCAVNIDLALEDLEGVSKSKTNYVKSKIEICFDPEIIKIKEIKKNVLELGYSIVD